MDLTCPICCDRLGHCGGPSTLPCGRRCSSPAMRDGYALSGHNGCLECFQTLQSWRPECPLCRAPFDMNLPLVLNTQLRDLMDELTKQRVSIDVDGEAEWEALPSSQNTTLHYSNELIRQSLMDDGAPSAPPLNEEVHITELTPPRWMPDSSSLNCMGCAKPFLPLMRTRHHCRLCGRLFCHECSTQHHLLPPRFAAKCDQMVWDSIREIGRAGSRKECVICVRMY